MTICKKNVSLKDIFIMIIYNLLLIISYLLLCKPCLDDLSITFCILPLIVVTTVIIHEFIHILFFKLLGKKQAKIKVLRDKKMKAIVIYQCNKNLEYSIPHILIILLTPAIILTLISIPLFAIASPVIKLIIGINALLNLMGSSIDITLSCKLLHYINKTASFDYDEINGVFMNIK